MADRERLLDEFSQLTGEPRDRAHFFLEASAWDLEKATDSFYNRKSEDSSSSGEQWPPTAQPPKNFASMGEYQRQKKASSKNDDSQSFFAGGSEHSGQLISGPPRVKKPEELAQEVFDAAKKQGAVSVDEERQEEVKLKKAAFVGQGYKLGQNEGPSEVIGRPQSSTSEDTPGRTVIKFWSDGFSIDDGPLRDGSSPKDKEFLGSVSRGEIPTELRHAAKGGEVNVEIEDHRTESFTTPKKRVAAFTGEGHKLGNMAPQVVQSKPSTSQQQQNTFSDEPKPVELSLDPDQPVTQLQIRLADGTRLVGKFNHSHTVGDIRKFINQSKPGSSHSYRLLTTFPNRELTDDLSTIADAKLINAVIIQRMK